MGDAPESGRISARLMQVYSRGRCEIRSTDPHDTPAVLHYMLEDPRDVVRLRFGARLVAKLVRHPAIAAVAAEGEGAVVFRSPW